MNKDLEQMLIDEKGKIDSMQAPEQLEVKLRMALDRTAVKKNRVASAWKKAVAAAIIGLCVLGTNYNALAYYGKKLLGFDEVINGTLRQLNEEGMGQAINKSTVLVDGTELVIDGVLNDANQFIMFYTLRNENGLDENSQSMLQALSITGFLTRSMMSSGVSMMNEKHTEVKGTMTFESVSPFAKKLTLQYLQTVKEGQAIQSSITFPYNPNQALATVLEQSINKKVNVDQGVISLDSITATRTVTVIDGVMRVNNLRKVDLPLAGVELYANDKLVQNTGSGMKSSVTGTKFDLNYEALPDDLESLKLVINRFPGYERLNQKINLSSIHDEAIPIGDKQISVTKIEKTTAGIEVTIITDEHVRLEGVSIATGNVVTELDTTIKQQYLDFPDKEMNKQRTLLFNSSELPEYMQIDGIHYMKEYNEVITIPID